MRCWVWNLRTAVRISSVKAVRRVAAAVAVVVQRCGDGGGRAAGAGRKGERAFPVVH